MSRSARERAAAIAGFLDAAAPGWAAGVNPRAHPMETLAALLEPHARRVGVDVPTYLRAHGWIDLRAPAGPFDVALWAEVGRRALGFMRHA